MIELPKQQPSQLVCALSADARIKLIGLGGVGCIVLQFLAMFLRSLMQPVRLVLIDGNALEPLSSTSRSCQSYWLTSWPLPLF